MNHKKPVKVIIPAAGSGRRMAGSKNKLLLTYQGKPIIEWVLTSFQTCQEIDDIIVVSSEQEIIDLAKGFEKVKQCVPGGHSRQESIAKALHCLEDEDHVLVHDGARPFVSHEIINRVIEAIKPGCGVIAGVPVKDTIKIVDKNQVLDTPNRDQLIQVQTPQGFVAKDLIQAYEAAAKAGYIGTDDASLVERLPGYQVVVVPGSYSNIKMTTIEDLKGAGMMKIGKGFDVHRLVEDRPLILGGVTIPFAFGLLGHSDADVLTHALMDGILGALGKGDIGRHFPDNDPAYKGISSMVLLERVVETMIKEGYRIGNVDITLIGEKPKIKPYVDQMIRELAVRMQVDPTAINIKGTTTEGLGFTGRGEGLAAEAVVLLLEDK